MIKKILVGAIAAGAISISLSSVASADIAADNPGTPGIVGVQPGCQVAAVAQYEPGMVPKAIEVSGTPGNFFSQYTPGHTK